MKKIISVSAVLALFGCASSGPIPIGKDTYMISKQSAGGMFVAASTIKVEIFKEAYAFCASQNKEFQVVSTNELGAIPAARMPSAEVQFMCLNEGDRDLARPKLRKEADTVIETRNR